MKALAILTTLMAVGGGSDETAQITIPSILLSPVEHAHVAARESGILNDLLVREGQIVAQGDLLAQIDDSEAKVARERALIELEVARRTVENDVAIRLTKKSLDVARAELKRAENAVEKYKKSVPATEMDQLRLTTERDKLAVEQSQHEHKIALATLKLKENQLKLAELKLAHRKIQAPFAGMIAEISYRKSEWVEPGEAVFRILRIDRLRAEGFIDARLATFDLVGKPVTLNMQLPGKPMAAFRGKIVFVSPEINPVNEQALIWAEIDNGELLLRPGLRAEMVIHRGTAEPTSKTAQ